MRSLLPGRHSQTSLGVHAQDKRVLFSQTAFDVDTVCYEHNTGSQMVEKLAKIVGRV